MEKKHVIFLTAMLFASLTIILAVINLKYGSYYPEKFYSYIVFSYVLIGLAFFTAIVSIIAESISCHKHLRHEKIAELEEQYPDHPELAAALLDNREALVIFGDDELKLSDL